MSRESRATGEDAIEEAEPREEWPLENIEQVGEVSVTEEVEDAVVGASVSEGYTAGCSMMSCRWCWILFSRREYDRSTEYLGIEGTGIRVWRSSQSDSGAHGEGSLSGLGRGFERCLDGEIQQRYRG